MRRSRSLTRTFYSISTLSYSRTIFLREDPDCVLCVLNIYYIPTSRKDLTISAQSEHVNHITKMMAKFGLNPGQTWIASGHITLRIARWHLRRIFLLRRSWTTITNGHTSARLTSLTL